MLTMLLHPRLNQNSGQVSGSSEVASLTSILLMAKIYLESHLRGGKVVVMLFRRALMELRKPWRHSGVAKTSPVQPEADDLLSL